MEFIKRDTRIALVSVQAAKCMSRGTVSIRELSTSSSNARALKIVATQPSNEPNASGGTFVVWKEVIEKHRTMGYADLKGLRIGIPARGNSVEYVLDRATPAGVLSLADAEIVARHAYPERKVGSRTSRTQSPPRLMASVVSMIAKPGKVLSHHAVSRYSRP